MNNPLNIVKTDSCSTPSEDFNEDSLPSLLWEGPICKINGQIFFPKISENEYSSDINDFNTVTITLDGHAKSELNWEDQLQLADRRVSEGYKILWNIDLGLFDNLPFSLLNKSQLMTLSIAIDHFLDNVWPKYEDSTLGVCIYKGSLNFASTLSWSPELTQNLIAWAKESYETIDQLNEDIGIRLGSFNEIHEHTLMNTECIHLYSSALCIDYLDMLAGRIPEELACFCILDVEMEITPLLEARMLTAERAEHLRFIMKGSRLPIHDITSNIECSPFGFFGCGKPQQPCTEKPPLGVCLPECAFIRKSYYKGLDETIDILIKKDIPFRVIPESLLTTEWDGLDDLIVSAPGVSVWGLRKLQGFCAAGGRVVSLEDNLGVVEEIPFSEWLKERNIQA